MTTRPPEKPSDPLYRARALRLVAAFLVAAAASPVSAQTPRIALDFNDVDLPVFVRFMSELTGKNFILDEKATGKISVFSPTKVTIDQAYSIFLSALEVSRLAAIQKGNVIQIVQVAEAPPERGVFVYKLKHANATETAAVLNNLVAKSQVVSTVAGSRPPLRPLSEFDAPVQVFADKPTNTLIVSSTRPAYDRLLSVIQELDARRKQVFVEAVILEVSMDRLRKIGVDPVEALGTFQVKSGNGVLNGAGGFNAVPPEVGSIAQALSGAVTGGAATVANSINVRAFLQLLLTTTDANILSTPQLLAADNQKAKIVVGENRPFPTGQAQGITGGTLVTIERKDVGVTLEMTPQVLENDLVRLEIKQEITAIAEGVSQTIGSGAASVPVGPTTTKRAMETITIAHDQQTIVVGGLVRDNLVINERRIPLLGSIPLLGWLFRSQSKQTEKLTLLVFLTPHLLSDEVDVVELNSRKATDLRAYQQDHHFAEPSPATRAITDRLIPEDRLTSSSTKQGGTR